MSKSRKTTRNLNFSTRSEFDSAVDEIATLGTKLRILEAKRDKRIQAVREQFEPEIVAAAERRDYLMLGAESYAFAHQTDLFGPKLKSAETPLANFGLRIGQPTLKTLPRWTWAKVMDAVRDVFPGAFIRVKEELDKDAIKAAHGKSPDVLASIGCQIQQTEAFWVEPKDMPREDV